MCRISVALCTESAGRLRVTISVSAHLSTFFCLTLMSDGRKAQGERGYLGWHEQLLTEKRDLLVSIATLAMPTLVSLCVYSLFVQSVSRWQKKKSEQCIVAIMLNAKFYFNRTYDSGAQYSTKKIVITSFFHVLILFYVYMYF